MCLQTQSLVTSSNDMSSNKRREENNRWNRANKGMQHSPALSYQMISHSFSQHQDQNRIVTSVRKTVSLKGQNRFTSSHLGKLHPPLFADELSFATRSRRTGRVAGLETLYSADRIILFLQLVLRCQCDFHMNMLQHTGFLSKQTAWQNFGGAIYWMCQNTKQKKWLLHFLGIV